MFEDVDPARMSREDALDALVAVRAELARLAALDAELLARAAGPTRTTRHVLVDGREVELVDEPREEIAAALRLSPAAAYHQIERARLLHGPLARTRERLSRGPISPAHANVICEQAARMHEQPIGVDKATDDRFELACVALERRVLARAERCTPGQTRTLARRAVAAIDAAGNRVRRLRAKRHRDVYCRAGDDGLGVVVAHLNATDAVWVDQLVSGLTRGHVAAGTVHALGIDGDATMGEVRAAAFLDLLRGSTTSAGVAVEVQVAIDAATLVGLTPDGPASVQCGGEESLVGRDEVMALMADPSVPVTLRRLICDPHTGALVDRGAKAYAVSEQLAAWLVARDVTCRFPGCTRRAATSDVDHATDFDAGGLTTIANTGSLCRRHHNAKTHSRWRIEKSQPDGSCLFISPTGRQYLHEPVRLLPDPAPPPATLRPLHDPPLANPCDAPPF